MLTGQDAPRSTTYASQYEQNITLSTDWNPEWKRAILVGVRRAEEGRQAAAQVDNVVNQFLHAGHVRHQRELRLKSTKIDSDGLLNNLWQYLQLLFLTSMGSYRYVLTSLDYFLLCNGNNGLVYRSGTARAGDFLAGDETAEFG